jgi:tetratricopeptide (TPR) repeat protein
LIAESYVDLKKYKRAIRILNELEKNGLSEMIVMKKLEIFKLTGEFEKGKAILNQLIKLFPESSDYHIIMAEYLRDSNDVDGSIQSFKRAYQLDSTNVYAISYLTDFYMEKKDGNNSLYYLSRAFTLMEIPLEKKISTLLYVLNNKEDYKNHPLQVEKLIRQLLILYPDVVDVKLLSYDYFSKSGQLTTAYEILQDILEIKKDNYDFWREIVYNASFLLKYDDVVKYSREALNVFPNKKEMSLFLGVGEYQKGEYDSALETLTEAYNDTIEPQLRFQFIMFIAEANYKLKNTEKAFQLFDSLLMLDSTNISVLNNYSYYLALEKRDLKKALKMSKKTILAEPENPTYLDTYAWVLYENGNYSEARVYMEKVIEGSEEKSAEVLFHYAEIMNVLGMNDIALEYYIKARDAGYKDEDLDLIINSL